LVGCHPESSTSTPGAPPAPPAPSLLVSPEKPDGPLPDALELPVLPLLLAPLVVLKLPLPLDVLPLVVPVDVLPLPDELEPLVLPDALVPGTPVSGSPTSSTSPEQAATPSRPAPQTITV
jgi:hypothetical protein